MVNPWLPLLERAYTSIAFVSGLVRRAYLSLCFSRVEQTEGMALAGAADLPVDKLLTVLDQGAMSNPMFRMKASGPAVEHTDRIKRKCLLARGRMLTSPLNALEI